MSSLVSIHTGMTRQNSFFAKYVPTNTKYGKTIEKLQISNILGNKARGFKTAPHDIRYYLSDKLPIGGRGQSNAVRFIGEIS